MTDTESEEDYHCGKCGIEDKWNDNCIRCTMRRVIEENKEAYERMGEIP